MRLCPGKEGETVSNDAATAGWEVAAIVLQRHDIEASARLEDVRFDSLARVLLIGEVHDRFGVVVEPATMDAWVTVSDLVAFVDGHAPIGD